MRLIFFCTFILLVGVHSNATSVLAADSDSTNRTVLVNSDGDVADILNDGTHERLAVDANVSGGVVIAQFTPRMEFDTSNTATNTSTDTELLGFTGKGKIDFIAIAGSNSNYEIIINIDSSEELRLTMSQLGSSISLANATNVPLWVETANTDFRWHPSEGTDFTASFSIEVKATGTPTPTVNWIILYREQE